MTDTSLLKGILFDKDGTLLDYAKTWVPVNHEVARIASNGDVELARRLLLATGMDPDTDYVTPDSLLAAGNTVEIMDGLVAAGSPLPRDVLVTELDRLFANTAEFAVPVTDLAAFFGRLHAAGYRLGVASSDNEKSIRQTASRFGFDEFLDYVAGYDSGYGVKPEPGMVLGFCETTGLAPHQVAVVGDNNHDLHMGRSAGAGMTIAVLTGTGSVESLSAASDHCLTDITGLFDILRPAQTADHP